jgi:tetratricopeptide (TPR) repeat protein
MRRGGRVVAALLAASVAGSVVLAALLDRRGAAAAAREEWLFLPDARLVRPMLLGFHGLAADLLWIRVIQYIGTHWQTDRRYPHLARALELTTELDPHFIEPYRFGSLYLLYLAGDPGAAVSLLKKGAYANPQRWELAHDLGRYYFLEARDDAEALRWWEQAVRHPDRPHYLPRFVARLHAKAGRVETALELWVQFYENAPDEYMRSLALTEIARLQEAHGPESRR